jgi:probable rRNA maturation factor
VSAFCEGILCALDASERPLVVVFVTSARMRELNREYRGRDYATDVLSFGYPDEIVDGQSFLGDIVIAPEVAFRQARNWRSGPEREVRKLLIHGILHLMGYDHDADDGEMIRIQRRMTRRRVFARGAPVAEM